MVDQIDNEELSDDSELEDVDLESFVEEFDEEEEDDNFGLEIPEDDDDSY